MAKGSAAWSRPSAVESGLGPSTGRGERPGAICRPWRAAWGRPPAVESDLGPSVGRGERPGAVPAIPNQQAIIEASFKQALLLYLM